MQICIYVIFVKNKIKNATCFICQKFDNKRYIDNQKVQEADEIKQDICKYLVSSDVEDDAWYNYVRNISSCAK